jgi:hypothetical protein
MACLRKALRHALVTELVHEDAWAVLPADQNRVERSRDCREADEARDYGDSRVGTYCGQPCAAPPSARLKKDSDLPVHDRSVTRPAEGLFPHTRGPRRSPGWCVAGAS